MGVGDFLPPVVVELRAKATELYSELAKVKNELEDASEKGTKSTGKLGTAFGNTAAIGQKLVIGVAGIATTVGGFAVEAAMSAEAVDAKLRTAIKNAGGDFEELEPKINATDKTMRKYGFTNDQTNTSLATLTVALKDPNKAMDAMSVAADLARQKNIDLNTASLLVAKAMEGQTRPLKALGIDLPIAASNAAKVQQAQDKLAAAQQKVNDVLAKYPDAANKASKGHDQYVKATEAAKAAQEKLADSQNAGAAVLDALKGRVKGAADAYGNTLKGQLDATKANVEALGESLGKQLIPWINKAIKAATEIFNYLADHQWILYTIATIVGVTMVAGLVSWGIQFAKTTAQTIQKITEWLGTHLLWNSTIMENYVEQGAASEESAAVQTAAQEEIQAAQEETAVIAEESAVTQVEASTEASSGMIAQALRWAAAQAVSIGETVALWAMYAAEGIGNAAVATAQAVASMIRKGVEWAAAQAASAGESIALWAMYAAEGIGKAAIATAEAVASMVASGVTWAATQATQIAEGIAGFVAWAAEHTVMAATFIAENVAMAAAATVAFIAENAATLGIVAAIGLVVAAVAWLVTHWSEAWDAVKTAAQWAYDNVIKPVGDAIVNYVIHPIVTAIQWYLSMWQAVWNGVTAAASWAYNNVISPIGSGIRSLFNDIVAVLQWFGNAWNAIWGAVGDALAWVYNHTIGPIVNVIKSAISGVMSVVNGVVGVAKSIGNFFGFADGGVVPGAAGAPMLAVVHGGEYVLSRDMLAGRQQPVGLDKLTTQPGDRNAAAFSPTAPQLGGGAGSSVTVIAQTNASPSQIASSVGWELRKRAS